MGSRDCDHEQIKTGSMKALKEALRRHEQQKGTGQHPWTKGDRRACHGRWRPAPVKEVVEQHDSIYDTEEER